MSAEACADFAAVLYGPRLSAAQRSLFHARLIAVGARVLAVSCTQRPYYEVETLDLEFAGSIDLLRRALGSGPGATAPGDGRMDPNAVAAAVVPTRLRTAARKLLVLDVDSTLIQQEVIELLAAHAGCEQEVAAVTEAAMRGELDFAQSLHARVAALAGLPADVIGAVRAAVTLSEGAADLIGAFKDAGHRVGVVSGGFSLILDPLVEKLGIDYAQANELEVTGGRLTGKVLGPVTDRAAKAAALRRWAADAGVEQTNTIAVGDGANDLDMLAAAGLGVAYNAKPAVAAAADACINIPQLDVLRYLAGVEG